MASSTALFRLVEGGGLCCGSAEHQHADLLCSAGALIASLLPFPGLQDPDLHVKHLKPSPPASAIVNRCIECGFCESNCPSRDITLTPRQRITTFREMARLRDLPVRSQVEEQR